MDRRQLLKMSICFPFLKFLSKENKKEYRASKVDGFLMIEGKAVYSIPVKWNNERKVWTAANY